MVHWVAGVEEDGGVSLCCTIVCRVPRPEGEVYVIGSVVFIGQVYMVLIVDVACAIAEEHVPGHVEVAVNDCIPDLVSKSFIPALVNAVFVLIYTVVIYVRDITLARQVELNLIALSVVSWIYIFILLLFVPVPWLLSAVV